MSPTDRPEHRSVRADRVRVPDKPSRPSPPSQPKPLERANRAVQKQSPSLAIRAAEATGPGLPHCVCLLPRRGLGRSCHPFAEAPGCEIRFPTPPKLRCSPSLPAQCRMSPNGDGEGVSTRQLGFSSRVRSPSSSRRHPIRRPKPSIVPWVVPHCVAAVSSTCPQAGRSGVQRAVTNALESFLSNTFAVDQTGSRLCRCPTLSG